MLQVEEFFKSGIHSPESQILVHYRPHSTWDHTMFQPRKLHSIRKANNDDFNKKLKA